MLEDLMRYIYTPAVRVSRNDERIECAPRTSDAILALELHTVPTGAVASATIGGQTAEIVFLGLTPGLVGVGQANLRVPARAPFMRGSFGAPTPESPSV